MPTLSIIWGFVGLVGKYREIITVHGIFEGKCHYETHKFRRNKSICINKMFLFYHLSKIQIFSKHFIHNPNNPKHHFWLGTWYVPLACTNVCIIIWIASLPGGTKQQVRSGTDLHLGLCQISEISQTQLLTKSALHCHSYLFFVLICVCSVFCFVFWSLAI